MTQIYSNENVKIIKDKNSSLFKIELLYSDAKLINSLIKTRIIQGATSTDDYRTLKFKASSVKLLKEFRKLTINETTTLVANLSQQLKYLITQENHTILGYAPENIIVIDEKKFAFLGSEFLNKIEDNNNILISYPFTTDEFFVSPELLNVKELPSYVHYKTAYFSLACLAVYVLLSDSVFYDEYLNHKNAEAILNSLNLHSVKDTRLYWLLSRCLVEEADKRSILFV
jgi:uncharacterized membrane protein YukC